MIKKVYHNYIKWEDYINGMYDIRPLNNKNILKAIEILSNENLFLELGLLMIKEWRISSEENLTNKNINRKAWIGQASCCFKCGITEMETKQAWKTMPMDCRINANKIAEKIINHYEANYNRVYKTMGKKMLSIWYS